MPAQQPCYGYSQRARYRSGKAKHVRELAFSYVIPVCQAKLDHTQNYYSATECDRADLKKEKKELKCCHFNSFRHCLIHVMAF